MNNPFRNLRPVLIFLAVCLTTLTVVAQGQSPTSPRPRPGLPQTTTGNPTTDAAPDPRDGRDAGAPRSARFGNAPGRFDRPTGNTSDGTQPPTRRETGRTNTSRGENNLPRTIQGTSAGDNSSSSAMVRGAGATAPTASSGQVSGNFDAILQREVTYPPLPDGGEVIMELIGPMTVSTFMEDIRIATLWNILVSESVKSRQLDFYVTEATPQQAMEILKFHDLYYEYDTETKYLYVMSIEEWQEREFGDLAQHSFALEHVDGTYVQGIIESLLSSRGRMVTDPRNRRIHVWDTDDNIELMTAAIGEADVPMDRAQFHVAYADFPDVVTALTSLLSANGSLLPDGRTSTVIVWDQPDVLERIGEALEIIDVPVATETFYLTHILAEDLIEHLEVMLSDRGIVQIDPRYNAIVVTDAPARIDRVEELLRGMDQALETRTWVVDYADLDFVAEQIESRIPVEMGDIIVQEEVHQITVTGIPERLDEIGKLIEVWDVQRKQVQIEAFIVEVGSDVEREFNINWSYFGSSNERPIFFDGGDGFNPDGGNLNVGQLPYSVPLYGALELDAAGGITRPLVTNIDGENVVSSIEGNNLAVTLEYLDQKNKATVLSSPRVAVQDGEEASFENKTEVPFVSATTFFNNNSLNNFANTNNTNRVEFIDVGTILRVLPRITTKDNILLDISAEDSTFVEVRILANDQQSTVPQKTVRKAETQLRIQSGDTVVLGGLRRDRAGETETRTPILGDLPGIGRLFRYPNRKSEKNTLLIFITPTIVDEFTDPQAAILARAEETIAGDHRHNQKSLWGRIADAVSQRENELSIAIGQSGDIHAAGERAALEALPDLFAEAPANVIVVLRRHPRAPDRIVAAVTEYALEANREIEVDDDFVPIVPRYRSPIANDASAPELEPSSPEES